MARRGYDVVRYGLTPAVWDWNHIELLENAAEKVKPKNAVAIHLKVNTGMNRLGVDLDDLPEMFAAIRSAPHIFLEGMFSHFAASEIIDHPDGEQQMKRFQDSLGMANHAGLTVPVRHMANSSAIVGRPKSWFNLVRPGLALYGYYLPFTSVISGNMGTTMDLPVKPALTWKSRIIQMRTVAAGQPVGYSSGYVTQSETRVAIVPVGYGDGLNRHLSSKGRVIVRNDYAAMIGNVSMNLTAVDVTGIGGVEVGDEVIIIGETESRRITAWEHAGFASTIPYDILCNLSARMKKIYLE